MDGLKPRFPLNTVQSVVDFFKQEVSSNRPNLTALSIVVGFFESQLTNRKNLDGNLDSESFPTLKWDVFEEMLQKFYSLIDDSIGDLHVSKKFPEYGHDVEENRPNKKEGEPEAETKMAENIKSTHDGREKVKRIADFVWSFLSTSFFKDRPHIQTVYSFLHDKRLDCFGIAFVVVAVAQYLGLEHIHLALSEDHAWVTFGSKVEDTSEVTWHGMGNKEKRGNPVNRDNSIEFKKDWLYLGGHEIKCDRILEVVAIVSTLNPGINSKTDSEIMGQIQQALLWMLYESGHLKKYPMAICNLADLEEIEHTNDDTSIDDLYKEAIHISEKEYSGYHVYPYTYYGGYLFRENRFNEATEIWAKASNAASRFTHSQQDEELYKDLHEIANTFFPSIVKRLKSPDLIGNQYFQNYDNFKNVLNFYDGVCLWEQDGYTSAVHSEWSKNFCKIISCFSHLLRGKVMQEYGTTEDVRDCFPKSEKMKLLINVISQEKINSQTVSLHLTSRVGLRSGKHSNVENTPGYVVPSPKRRKR